MIRAFFFSIWIGLGRLVLWAILIFVTALMLLRLVTWGAGREILHEALVAEPQITLWQMEHPQFGGLSALLMAPDGAHLLAGGDHGALITADIDRDATGGVTAIAPREIVQARLRSGHAPTEFKMDLEALTRHPRGGWMLGYEGYVRLEHLTHLHAVPIATHRWELFVPLFGNQAFEALATLPDDRLIAITETRDHTGMANSVIWTGGSWTPGPKIPVSRGYRITGADVGPDGCLYLLERRYSVAGGFRFGVRRLSGGPEAWKDTLLYRSAPAQLGNAEGIAVWQAAEDHVTLSIVTDDGFLPLTATRLIELRTRPGQDCQVTF